MRARRRLRGEGLCERAQRKPAGRCTIADRKAIPRGQAKPRASPRDARRDGVGREKAMSRLFGPMRQVGIVVRDIDKAMRHWVEVCGVGPWFYAEQLPMDEFRYRGRPYDIKVSIALANSGDVQLELIQQRCESPSLYRDFLAAGHEGMQHWSSWPVNYHEIRERALKSGWEIGQEGDTPRGPFVYFLNEGHPGTSSRWPRRRRPGCASSTRSARRRSTGTGTTRSG